MLAVEELHRIVHQPVIDTGHGQGGNGGSLGSLGQDARAGGGREQLAQCAPVNFAFAHMVFPNEMDLGNGQILAQNL